MGEIKNLNNNEAIKKLKELAEDINVCMFCTKTENVPFQTRPMSTQEVDDEGNIWFFSEKDSDKNYEIKQDQHVQLLYSKNSDSHFLSVAGIASIVYHKNKVEKLWDKIAEAWFKGGKDDPNLSLICIKPTEAYYWETKNGKMISLIKIAVAAISGSMDDDGIEGKINI